MTTPKVTLTSYNMGDVKETDFAMWRDLVAENLSRLVEFDVDIDAYEFGESAPRDHIGNATSGQTQAIREALETIWTEFCGGAWDAAYDVRARELAAELAHLNDGRRDLFRLARNALNANADVTAEELAEIVRCERPERSADLER